MDEAPDFVVQEAVELDGRAGDDEEARAHGDEDDELQREHRGLRVRIRDEDGGVGRQSEWFGRGRETFIFGRGKRVRDGCRAWGRIGACSGVSITCAIDVSQVASSLAFLRSFAPSCASFGENARVGSTSEDTPSMSASARPPLAMLTHDAFMMPGRTHRANAAIAAPSASSWLVLDTDRISETDDGSAIGGSAAVFTTLAARTFFA